MFAGFETCKVIKIPLKFGVGIWDLGFWDLGLGIWGYIVQGSR